MASLKQHLRQRLVLHDGHQSGAIGPYPIVKEYDGNATVAFPGVKIGASGISRPADPKIMSQWLNVNEWDVTVTFGGTTIASFPDPWAIAALNFTLASGRTATIAEDGASVSFDSTTPVTKADLYRGLEGDYRKTRIVWGPLEASVGTDPVYTRRTSLEIEIVHGAWGHHNIDGEWMLRLDVDVVEEVNETSEGVEYTNGGIDHDEENPPEFPVCDSGYSYREGSLVFIVDSWYWTCEVPATDVTHRVNLLTDPDAAVDAGDFMAHTILCRWQETVESDYGVAPAVEITIAPAGYYSGWI